MRARSAGASSDQLTTSIPHTASFMVRSRLLLKAYFGSGHDYVPVEPNVRFLKIHSLKLPVRCRPESAGQQCAHVGYRGDICLRPEADIAGDHAKGRGSAMSGRKR